MNKLMCGIVGNVSSNPSLDEIQRINDLLIHRGPEDSGIYLGVGISMAARRLSIVENFSVCSPYIEHAKPISATYSPAF